MKKPNIPLCVHPCFEGLIVVNDACKPIGCSGDVKTLHDLSDLDIKQMELLADGNNGKKTYVDVANDAINKAWVKVIEYVEEELGDKFSIKNELFNDMLCDKPEREDCVTFSPDGLTGIRVKFFANTKSACNTLTHIGVWKLNGGNGNYNVTVKETGTQMSETYVLPLTQGWNNVALPSGGHKMQGKEIDICFDENSDLVIGSYEPCLSVTGCTSCGNTPKVENGYKQAYFVTQGLISGGYDSSPCPQIGGIVPTMKSECKIEDFLCCYKHDLCKLVIKQVDVALLTYSMKPNCVFHAENGLGHEWNMKKIEGIVEQMKRRLKTLCNKIMSNTANNHDICLNCESTFSQGYIIH